MTDMKLSIRRNDIGAAIAEAVLNDIRVNLINLPGFPQIVVAPRRTTDEDFQISIQWNERKSGFTITPSEAEEAVRFMKEKETYYPPLMERVMTATSRIERDVDGSNAPLFPGLGG